MLKYYIDTEGSEIPERRPPWAVKLSHWWGSLSVRELEPTVRYWRALYLRGRV